jgi:signal transduction histidine kinase
MSKRKPPSTHRVRDTLLGLLTLAEELVRGPQDHPTALEPAQLSPVLAQRLAEVIRAVMDCQRVDIAELEHATGTLRPLALLGFAPEEEAQWWADWCQSPFANLHLVEPILLSQVHSDAVLEQDAASPPFHERPNPFGIRSWLFAPLWVNTEVVGALGLDNRGAVCAYQPEDLRLVQALARLGALLLERERLLEEREEARARVLALQEANQRLDAFLGLAGHELKTPLTLLTLQVQLAQRRLQQGLAQAGQEEGELTERLQAAAAQLDTTGVQLARIERLVQELLDTTRVQADHLDLHLCPVNVAALVREVVEEQRQLEPTRQLDLCLEGAGEVWVLADADRLAQVLTNYLSNARKYSPETAPVLGGVERAGEWVQVWVRDQGPGLPVEQQTQIWERFYRVPGIEVQSGSGVGLGLGLYLCKSIIERQGGHVGVQSRPGAGATFWFRLPLLQADAGGTETTRWERWPPADGLSPNGHRSRLPAVTAGSAALQGVQHRGEPG